jgi:hypothetical protein
MSAGELMLYLGSIVLVIWGAMHILQGTPGVVSGFGALSDDNRRILTMEWVGGGLTLCFIGALVILMTLAGDIQSAVAVLVIRFQAVVLVIRAIWEAMTGAKTPVIQFKICVGLQIGVAVLYLLATLV